MIFTRINEIPVSKSVIATFKGYNHNLRIGTGEFYDMKNMTGDFYPLLSPRSPRKRYTDTSVQAMVSQNGLCYLENKTLHYADGKTAELEVSDGKKQLVTFGAYIVVLPDNLWFNTVNAESGLCETAFQSDITTVGIVWCGADGTVYETVVDGTDAPENTQQIWLDTSAQPPILKKYYEESRAWSEVSPTYLKVISEQIGDLFEAGNSVSFECTADQNELTPILGSGVHTITAKGRDFIVVEGKMNATRMEIHDIQFSVKAQMPLMDFVFEHENRLWGCRYGLNRNGDFVNEIYASKLGDFKSWSSFSGISTDSYIASCGTDGKWTGAINAMGYPLFFKENYLHKVYGSYPAEYQIQTLPCMGVQEGCADSLAVVGGVLFYKSRSGVCIYDGSLPSLISEALGNVSYHDAVAGGLGSKYFISMQDENQEAQLFCFDTQKGLWHKEDNTNVKEFCTVGNTLFFNGADGLWAIGDADGTMEGKISWYAQTGILGCDEPNHKYLSSITVRLSLAVGATVRFLAQYDSCGTWHSLASITGKHLNSFSIPLRPKRCDHMCLRIEGLGDAKIYAITLTTEQGSDIR